jgi:hypothetical protein
MPLRRAPLPAYAPGSDAAEVYASLWAEVEVTLKQAAFTNAVPLSSIVPEPEAPAMPSALGRGASQDRYKIA